MVSCHPVPGRGFQCMNTVSLRASVNKMTSIECFKSHSSELLWNNLLLTSAEVNIFITEVAN